MQTSYVGKERSGSARGARIRFGERKVVENLGGGFICCSALDGGLGYWRRAPLFRERNGELRPGSWPPTDKYLHI